MSNEALNRIWASETSGGASHRLTLIALADMINLSGFCWASLDTLAEKVQSVKRRQLINVLADLEARGEIWVLRRKREQGRNGINYYVVNAGLSAAEMHAAADGAQQHARANGWISAIDCTNEETALVHSSTDISATDCTNRNGISALQYRGLVHSSTDISAIQYQGLVQSAAPDPSYDPIGNPGEGTQARATEPPQPPRASPPPPVVVVDYIPDRMPERLRAANGYLPAADPPEDRAPRHKPPPSPEEVAIGEMANALTDVTGVAARLNWNRVQPMAASLVEDGYTCDQVRRHFGRDDPGPGAWWYWRDDWRGRTTEKHRAEPPTLAVVQERIALGVHQPGAAGPPPLKPQPKPSQIDLLLATLGPQTSGAA